ncbi:MAG TPA: hypothetical protein VF128_13875 [Gemmatimonadaceae bacterium]
MRASVMLGTALIVIGGTVFLRGLSAPRPTLNVGDPVTVQPRSPAVPWVIGLSILAGIALVTTGRRRQV